MAGISVNYAGTDLAQWFIATDVTRGIGANHVNTTQVVGKSDGQMWQYSRLDTKTITVTGVIQNANLAQSRRELGAALEHNGPAPLIFGDDVSVYYNALAEGQDSITEDWRSGTVTLTFTVPDGVAHAVTPTEFTNKGSDGLNTETMQVTNKGSYPAYPVITATMLGDNGVVAVANSNGGAIQFGNPEDADGVAGIRSDRAASYECTVEPTDIEYNKGAMNYSHTYNSETQPNKMQGSFKWGQRSSKQNAVPVFENSGNQYWAGPSIHKALSANYNNVYTGDFQLWTRIYTNSNTKTRFRMEFTLQSGDDVALNATLRSSSRTKDELIFECWAQGKLLKSYTLNRKKFVNGWQAVKIERHGDKVKWAFAKVNSVKAGDVTVNAAIQEFSSTVSGISKVNIDSLTMWTSQWQQSATPEYLDFTDIAFTWINEPDWTDVPNLYAKGDVLTIDTLNRAVLLNGVVDNSLQTVGNNWDSFALAPGDSTLQLISSSWADMYDCTVDIREAYV